MNQNKILAESIAKDYMPKPDSKIGALKRLDAKVKRPPAIFAYIRGSLFSLVLGTGMSLAMQVIGSTTQHMILGIVIGCIGIAACAVNYPIYKAILKKRKAKYAFEIVELAREICEETENN